MANDIRGDCDEIEPESMIPDVDEEDDRINLSPDIFEGCEEALSQKASTLSLSPSSQAISTLTSFPSYNAELERVNSIGSFTEELPLSQARVQQMNDSWASSPSSNYVIEDPSSSSPNNSEGTITSDSDNDGEEGVPEVNQRKRNKRPQPHEWKKNKRHANKNLGLEYTTIRGTLQPAKRMLSSCQCQFHCGALINGADRSTIFEEFWNLGDINRQRELLNKLVIVEATDHHTRRKNKITYRFKVNNTYIQVCKVFFLKTLDISEKKVRVMLKKEQRNLIGSVSPDRRGHHEPINKLTQEDIKNIQDHLALLPKVPPHWCRRDTSKIFLEGFHTKESVYQLYSTYAMENGLRLISNVTYFKQLEDLNIGFHQPRKDQCWCANFYKLSDVEKAEKQAEYDIHIKRKDAARDQKNYDTKLAQNDETVMTAVFDLEAILYSPFVKTKDLFYRRKMATHNFTVFDVGKKEGYCYIWPENHGKKGSQEIATCLAKFISEEVPDGVKVLNFYADNCAGQNKNSIVVAMMGLAVQEHATLKEINLKFLESGHTYMECDNMHSVIERAARDKSIYIPAEWVEIIRQAKKTGKQYNVYEMQFDKFLNYKQYKDQMISSNLRYTDNSKVGWKCGKWFKVECANKRCLFIKNEFWEPFKTVILKKSFKKDVSLQNLYNSQIPISCAKFNDLRHFCTSGTVPSRYHRYYQSLSVDDETDDGDNGNGIGVVPP